MFSYTGLSKRQVPARKETYGMNHDCPSAGTGRISVAGLNTSRIQDFINAVDNLIQGYSEWPSS
ncbi:uncharacterized protein N7459_004509, partial [Penicillium hispanicum]|uniref:uncharacterized protein n=1 Tax=Penicillium hispanicum TaxID=1080232 RepID=UPI002540D59E